MRPQMPPSSGDLRLLPLYQSWYRQEKLTLLATIQVWFELIRFADNWNVGTLGLRE
jgi:hypothetical protein